MNLKRNYEKSIQAVFGDYLADLGFEKKSSELPYKILYRIIFQRENNPINTVFFDFLWINKSWLQEGQFVKQVDPDRYLRLRNQYKHRFKLFLILNSKQDSLDRIILYNKYPELKSEGKPSKELVQKRMETHVKDLEIGYYFSDQTELENELRRALKNLDDLKLF